MNSISINRPPMEIVRAVLTELAEDLGYAHLNDATADTPLFGGDDGIDSLSLVHVVAGVERAAHETYGRSIVLADERAMSRRTSPFRTAGTLAALLEERLGE